MARFRILGPGTRTVDLPKSFASQDIGSYCVNEHEFHDFIDKSPEIWRSLGWDRIVKSDPFFPDVIARLDDGRLLRVELEYEAENYNKHGHPSTADLVLSFSRAIGSRFICGTPVWSFYQREPGGYVWSLDNDRESNGYDAPGVVNGVKKQDVLSARTHRDAVRLIVYSAETYMTAHEVWSVGQQLGRSWHRSVVHKACASLGFFDSGDVLF